jgi:26S proteasome regulatory subunit N7
MQIIISHSFYFFSFCFFDHHADQFIHSQIAKLADESGDWDRRNRLKVYNSLQKLLTRDVKTAASLLIDCIATFSCAELCSYTDFILYTMVSNLLYLPRTEIKSKIIDGPEIRSVKEDVGTVYKMVSALYDCDYKAYLHAMVEMESVLLADRFLQPHAGYIMRELHVLGYKQFLDSYKSVTLESMAGSFGVGVEFLDSQLSRFVAAGRLSAKIDKFGGVVETNRPDLKNAQYRDMIQQGDLLLNRIQKLARVVDV